MNPKQDPIREQELVLIHIEEQPAFYARVEKITADAKPKWWQVRFLMLTFPIKITTWIIDEEQIRGADFTMSGTPIRIEKVEIPKAVETTGDDEKGEKTKGERKPEKKQARVLSLNKKKKS